MSQAGAAAQTSDRIAGGLAIACAVASFALLAEHPNEQAQDFAGMVQEEARNQLQNLVVHGGYMLVGAVQIVCFSFLSSRLSGAYFAARAAFVLFTIGIAWLCVSLLFDGIVAPGVAARYQDQADAVRPMFVLIGTIVRFVMPVALGFQAIAICLWGVAMLASGLRVSGAVALLLGLALVGAVAAGALGGVAMAFMAAFAALGLWGFVAGAVLLRGSSARG